MKKNVNCLSIFIHGHHFFIFFNQMQEFLVLVTSVTL
jgi:hypothetical protein